MPAPEERDGGHLLSSISNEIVRAQKRYWGKGPVKAKSYMFDDMLFVVMQGGARSSHGAGARWARLKGRA